MFFIFHSDVGSKAVHRYSKVRGFRETGLVGKVSRLPTRVLCALLLLFCMSSSIRQLGYVVRVARKKNNVLVDEAVSSLPTEIVSRL